jgi:hypothetical protein
MGGCLSTSAGESLEDLELHREAEKQLKEVYLYPVAFSQHSP